jgi:threonine dehydratase
MAPPFSVTLDNIKRVRSALRGRTDSKLHLRTEKLQRAGTYKDPCARNAVLELDDVHKRTGVIAACVRNDAGGRAHGRDA